jgi:hypothetical protein
MNKDLEKLQQDLLSYRTAVEKIFYSTHATSSEWRRYFIEILTCALHLYLDYAFVVKSPFSREGLSVEAGGSGTFRLDNKAEKTLREKLQQELDASPCWNRQFIPENSFSKLIGLQSRKDYIDKFTLHLPEIYGESFRVEAYIKECLTGQKKSAFAQLFIGLQHLARNHISFVLQALEWAADEDSWEL